MNLFTLPQLLALATFLASCFLCSSPHCFAQTPAQEWDALFQQTEGWLGADGIYSLDLGFDSASGIQLDLSAPQLLWFSDTFCGETRNNGTEYGKREMVNHSFAVMEGRSPDKGNIHFFFKRDWNSAKAENIIEGHYWLQDGIRYGNKVWLTGILVGEAWKPRRIDAITIALDPETNRPDFTKIKVDDQAPLSIKRNNAQAVWGAAILDVCDDGYIYVYGYVDRFKEGSRKDMVVARVPREKFEDYDEWSFFNGNEWTKDRETVFESRAAVVRNVSTEFSITPIPVKTDQKKYILVYTPGTISEKVAFRVGDSPTGPFNEEQVFYSSPIPREIRGVRCYNAKAHPIFSNDKGLLVSYNVNRLGNIARKPDEYRPRFIWLKWDVVLKAAE